jgi:hypothetical protein
MNRRPAWPHPIFFTLLLAALLWLPLVWWLW